MERSLQDYEDTVTLVNHVVTTSYILIKYLVGPVLWLMLERANKRRRGRRRRQKKCGCLSLGTFVRSPALFTSTSGLCPHLSSTYLKQASIWLGSERLAPWCSTNLAPEFLTLFQAELYLLWPTS